MRKIFLSLLLIACSVVCSAQDTASNKKPQTKLEQLSLEEGTIIKKEFLKLGTIKGVEVEFLTITDIPTNTIARGLRISMSSGGVYSIRSSYTAFLDLDEVNGLIKFLEFIKPLNEKPSVYTEYNYQSRGHFKVYAYAKEKGDWYAGVYVDRFFSNSDIELKDKDIDALLQMANKAKSKM